MGECKEFSSLDVQKESGIHTISRIFQQINKQASQRRKERYVNSKKTLKKRMKNANKNFPTAKGGKSTSYVNFMLR